MLKTPLVYTIGAFFICFFINTVNAQDIKSVSKSSENIKKTQNQIFWPIKKEIFFTSNFMEDRPGRFHAGLDLRTFGQTLPLYAIEDGFVSRINVSPWGYGRAIYIKGKSGKTFVYAHTDRFATFIEAKVLQQQYKAKRYRVNFYPKKDEIVVKKGDLIGYSGSTGIGPSHLHFEIRDINNAPINPEIIGYTIDDTVKPELKKVVFTPLTDSSLIDGYSNIKSFTVDDIEGDTITFEGQVGLSIAGYDKKSNNSRNKLGIYKYLLKTGKDTLFFQKNHGFGYEDGKYAYQDRNYNFPTVAGVRAKNLYRSSFNKAKFYSWAKADDGVLYSMKNDSVMPVEILVFDTKGNKSAVSFFVKGENNFSFTPPYLSILATRFGKDYLGEKLELITNDSTKKSLYTSDIKLTFYYNSLRVISSIKADDLFVKNAKGTFKLQKDKKAYYLPYYNLDGGDNEFLFADSSISGYQVKAIGKEYFYKITPDTTYEISLSDKQKLVVEKNSTKKNATYFVIEKKNVNLKSDGFEIDKDFLNCVILGRSKYLIKPIKGVYKPACKGNSMQLYTKSGKRFIYHVGGIKDSLKYNHGFNTAYVLQRDIIPPKIIPSSSGKSITIEEFGSGITSDTHIKTTFNGKFILNEYDPETKRAEVIFTTVEDKGILIYNVRDRAGNTARWRAVIE